MMLRAACAALVLSVAACSSSGGHASAPSSSSSHVPPADVVSCADFAGLPTLDRAIWSAGFLNELARTRTVILDPTDNSSVTVFERATVDACAATPAKRVAPIAYRQAVDLYG